MSLSWCRWISTSPKPARQRLGQGVEVRRLVLLDRVEERVPGRAAVAVAEAAELRRVVLDPAPQAGAGALGADDPPVGLEVIGHTQQQVHRLAAPGPATPRESAQIRWQPGFQMSVFEPSYKRHQPHFRPRDHAQPASSIEESRGPAHYLRSRRFLPGMPAIIHVPSHHDRAGSVGDGGFHPCRRGEEPHSSPPGFRQGDRLQWRARVGASFPHPAGRRAVRGPRDMKRQIMRWCGLAVLAIAVGAQGVRPRIKRRSRSRASSRRRGPTRSIGPTRCRSTPGRSSSARTGST